MKNRYLSGLVAMALVAATSLAIASPLTASTAYEFNGQTGESKNDNSELRVGLGYKTAVGTIDGAVVFNRFRYGDQDETNGFELGYSNGVKLGPVAVTGRAAYGRKYQFDGETGTGYTGRTQYFRLGVDGAVTVAGPLAAYTGYRHTGTFHSVGDEGENQYGYGGQVSIDKAVFRVGGTHTIVNGRTFNGLALGVSTGF
jgi:hypothetical protein